MARKFLKLCGAALIFAAGWKAKEKTDNMLSAPKPATVVAKLSRFWDGVSATGKKPQHQQAEEAIRREGDRIKAELHREMLEGQRRLVAALAEEMKRPRDDDARPEDNHHQRDPGNSRRPPPS